MSAQPARRVDAIDILRGVVMILMALDHVRFFFTDVHFPPENMEQTWMALFLTRWVTHFCAPLFFLLAGMSAYLSGTRRSRAELAGHLWRRGLWLIALELTIIGFAWSFVPGSSFAGVIWCLGWSMIVLSLLVRLPIAWSLAFGLITIGAHNLLDGREPQAWWWHFIRIPGFVELPRGIGYFVLFPLIAWVGVMALGYAMGPWLQLPVRDRARRFAIAGTIATLLFVALRLTNIYGNPTTSYMRGGPGHFHAYPTIEKTIIAFLNTEKYPPSLQFLLMTLGPSLLLFALLDRMGIRARVIATFGRVPFFYYVLHLYLIHLLSLVIGRGSLVKVWTIWLIVVAVLYFPCRWFEKLKERRRDWWLSYV